MRLISYTHIQTKIRASIYSFQMAQLWKKKGGGETPSQLYLIKTGGSVSMVILAKCNINLNPLYYVIQGWNYMTFDNNDDIIHFDLSTFLTSVSFTCVKLHNVQDVYVRDCYELKYGSYMVQIFHLYSAVGFELQILRSTCCRANV